MTTVTHIWILQFHADNLSSAHVYLRLKPGDSWTSIPQTLLEDCAQLTKANSIEGIYYLLSRLINPSRLSERLHKFTNSLPGNKKDNVTIIYTPWSNLRKDASMATGQVSFHDPKLTEKILVPVRQNPIINRLNKTKEEKFPDLHAEREEDLREKRKMERIAREEKKRAEKKEREERELKRYQKDHAYDDIMNEEDIAASSNQDREGVNPEDDFF
jgi:NFACT protein RNA binding domain